MYPYIKALHIIMVVSWFAGLFYIVRLFVYMTETLERPANERDVLLPQLQLMARRLWFGIATPAGIAAVTLGLWLLWYWWPAPLWLQLKLGAVVGLIAYHAVCHWLNHQLQQGVAPWSSTALRVWNEVATLFLVGIVFLVVVREALSLVYGVVGLVVFAGVLMAAITAYRRLRAAPGRTG